MLLPLFVVIERRGRAPMLDLEQEEPAVKRRQILARRRELLG